MMHRLPDKELGRKSRCWIPTKRQRSCEYTRRPSSDMHVKGLFGGFSSVPCGVFGPVTSTDGSQNSLQAEFPLDLCPAQR